MVRFGQVGNGTAGAIHSLRKEEGRELLVPLAPLVPEPRQSHTQTDQWKCSTSSTELALANSGDEANQKTTTLPCTRIFIEYRRNHHHHQENVGKQNKVYVFVDCHRSLGFGQNTERTWKGRGERAQPDPGDDESVVTSIKLNQQCKLLSNRVGELAREVYKWFPLSLPLWVQLKLHSRRE